MKFDRQAFRRRKRERMLRFLHENNRLDAPPAREQQIVQGESNRVEYSGHRNNRLFIQTCGSLALFLVIYSAFFFNGSLAKATQEFIREALTRDFNFDGVTEWVETQMNQYPSLLPTITVREKDEQAIPVYLAPFEGTVVEDFLVNGTGIMIEGVKGDEVRPITTGWVRYAGETLETKGTVIIQHSGGHESLYGFLGEIYVKENDWVYAETVIGSIGDHSLYLQLKKGVTLINPLEVISFE